VTEFNEGHVTATFAKRAACPHCGEDVSVTIEVDRGVVALTTILSGFYESPREFDLEVCIDEGLEELDKKTNVRLERGRST
jgi:hypothetical protein